MAAVRFGSGGREVRTRTDPRLPNGFKAAVELLAPGHAPEGKQMSLEALDERGQVVEMPAESYRSAKIGTPGLSGWAKHRQPGSAHRLPAPTVYWMPPAGPPSLPCSIHSGAIPGLQPQWGNVATRLTPIVGVDGSAFLPCADTEFYWHGWPLEAAVLLDAAHPGIPPATLPQAQPVAGHPGVFDAPGSIQGHLTGRRVGDAWLVVQGGTGLGQRLAVLNDITIIPPAPMER